MKRRILSMLLLAALVIGLLPQGMLPVSAYSETDIAYPVEGGNIYFAKETGTITDCDETVTKADIPAEIDGAAVEIIGDRAFSDCSALTSVRLPNGVKDIGRRAFFFCTNLADINIPDSVTHIDGDVFYETAIYNAAERWTDGVLYIDSWLINIDGTVLGDYAITSGTKGIADGAFGLCSSLTGVTIPGSVMTIGAYAFTNCSALTGATISDGVTSIGDYAFRSTGLTSVTLPESVESLGVGVFYGCNDLKDAVILDGLTSIEADTFRDTGLTSVTLPESVTSIGTRAFYGCSTLTDIEIPDSVNRIEADAFYDTVIYNAAERWTDGVLYLEKWLIKAETSISGDYIIASGTTGIADNAFMNCRSLTSATIPEGVISIGNSAFGDCRSMTEVTIPSSVTSIGDNAFSWTALTSVILPESVTSIGSGTFYGCSSLVDITIPNSVTEIGSHAFRDCKSLTSITIPGSVTSISERAFYACSSLQSVYFLGDAPALGENVFGIWDTETKMYINIPGLTLYYIEGKEGWTAPTWKGYPTATWVPHVHSYADTVTAPTCTEQGYTAHTCACGDSYFDAFIPALGHDFGAWTKTKAPTCTEKGEEKRTCSHCDAFETKEIAAHGHTEVADAAVPATCTEAGKTEGKHCNLCGAVIVAQETVPAMGHSFKDGVCTVCGAKDPDAQPAAPVEFSDVSEKAWYYEAVEYAVEKGLMNGVGGGKFDPEGTMTRAMLVTVLWRYEGKPMEGENSFTDVPNGTWYTDAVAWAAANGIVGGVGNGKFDPEGSITREQMTVILFRYAGKKGVDTSKRSDLSGFPDSGAVSSWAKDAMRWAVAEKIINGSDGYLLPQGNATRAQVATILMRFLENIVIST